MLTQISKRLSDSRVRNAGRKLLPSRVRRFIVQSLCSPAVGDAIFRHYGGMIPSRGLVFDTTGTDVPRFVVPRLLWGFYESGEIEFVCRYLDPAADVVELGSCIGVVSAHVARRQRRDRKLVCVEANPRLINTIRSNLDLNVPGNTASVVNAAVDYSGARSIRFELSGDAVSSRISDGEVEVEFAVEVATVRLDDLRTRYELGDYALICDVEGAEAGFIFGPPGILDGCRQIIIELHPVMIGSRRYTVNELAAALCERHGFDLRAHRGDVYYFDRP